MEQNKDQGGAAVRGEAVAEFTYKGPDGRFLDSGEWWVENSEIGNHMALPILRNGKTIALVFSEAHDDCKQEIEENCRLLCSAGNSARAADALDSQPTEPDGLPPLPEPIEVGGEGWDFDDFKSEKTFSCEHMWAYARAAIASSQPADGGVRNGNG